MIIYKTNEEIKIMREGGKRLGMILQTISGLVQSGVEAAELEAVAQKKIKETGAMPAFLNYNTGHIGIFPSALCISINEEVVHGIPGSKVFQEGDIVGIDCGIWYNGLCVDAAITVPCGVVDKKTQKLLNVTKEGLGVGIRACREGNYIGDIGAAIQKYVEGCGFFVIKSLVGHGVGKKLHEDPQIPNFAPFDHRNPKNKGPRITAGMTLAIEPMISIGSEDTTRGDDGFAAITRDHSLSAHFEHTVAVTKKGTIILTL